MEEKTTPLYWTYKQASKETGIPVGTYYSWVSKRRIPHLRLGSRHVLFLAAELLVFLEAHRQNPKPTPEATS